MVAGVLGAIAQDEFRRVLSFLHVSQIGYTTMGLALWTPAALGGSIFFMVIERSSRALFLVSGLFLPQRRDRTECPRRYVSVSTCRCVSGSRSAVLARWCSPVVWIHREGRRGAPMMVSGTTCSRRLRSSVSLFTVFVDGAALGGIVLEAGAVSPLVRFPSLAWACDRRADRLPREPDDRPDGMAAGPVSR